MKRDEFEAAVLDLWVRSRIELTRAHLQYHTKQRRKKIGRWLDDMVLDGTLEIDVTDDGEMVWSVPGAARPVTGARTFAEFHGGGAAKSGRRAPKKNNKRAAKPDRDADKLNFREALEMLTGDESDDGGKDKRKPKKKKSESTILTGALSTLGRATSALDKPREPGEKSLLLSAGLGFLGPLGWLYAGSFREAVPAILAYVALAAVFPSFLLMPLLWFILPLSSVAGLVYAWQYNRNGKRTPLFLDDGKDDS